MLFSKLNLDPGETIIIEVRRHWFVFIWNILLVSILGILPIAIFVVTIKYFPESTIHFIGNYFFAILFGYCLWLLFLWVVLFIQWTNYYLDVWYITEKRIIDIEQKMLFHREVSNLRFDKIQDITVEVHGIIATFLKFGDLKVQTASEDSSNFFMKNASHPEDVRRVVFSHHNKEAEMKNAKINPFV